MKQITTETQLLKDLKQMQQILELILDGYTIREIGAKLGIAKSKVWRMIENFKTKIGEIRNAMEY